MFIFSVNIKRGWENFGRVNPFPTGFPPMATKYYFLDIIHRYKYY